MRARISAATVQPAGVWCKRTVARLAGKYASEAAKYASWIGRSAGGSDAGRHASSVNGARS